MTITAYFKEYKNTVMQKNLMFKFVAFYDFNILLLLINLHDPSNAGFKTVLKLHLYDMFKHKATFLYLTILFFLTGYIS